MSNTAPPAPLAPIPSPRQMAWQRREVIGFVHFTVNTFSDREWGLGTEDPSIFDPTELDAGQWVGALASAGAKMVILTAKHHDGFCLWPSALTDHSVKSSPWRDGKGDVVRELSEACAAEGLDFGVYLSPWDRHEPSYGSGQAYNDYYVAQLTELLTGYGPIKEVWFDGACGEGPNGKRQVYDFARFWGTVRDLAPEAVMFSDAGPDVRWVGNESGYSADESWSTVDRCRWGVGANNQHQTSGHEGGADWLPPETDVSIRPGWFYHSTEDNRVKSLEKLLDIYYNSVGLNSVLLLNVPPDQRGLVHENDVARLAEFGAVISATFARDLAEGRPAIADNVRGGDAVYAAGNVTRSDPDSYWATDDGVTAASVGIDLGGPTTFNVVALGEAIRLGQRVRRFHVEALVDGEWRPLGEGRTIGYRRLLRLAPVTASLVRVTIDDARACPCLSTLSLFLEPPKAEFDTAERAFDAGVGLNVGLVCAVPGAEVRYTLDGSEPTPASPLATEPLRLGATTTVRARAWYDGVASPYLAEATFEALTPATACDSPTEPGYAYTYYEGGWQTHDQMSSADAVERGQATSISLAPVRREQHCALEFAGHLQAPAEGMYRFWLTSDDGSRLWVGDRLVIDNDGLHGEPTERSGVANLGAGAHRLAVAWFCAAGGQSLAVEWAGPGFERRPLGS